MTLYLKHRPKCLDDVIGNQDIKKTLRNYLQMEDKPHSFLFHGPTGCGKTTQGRIIANELGCKGSDLREVDSAEFRGIDTIREIRKQSQYRPLEGPCKVWILDECHKLSSDAQSALLKALEDTPRHVYYILCTTDPDKLIKTIRGRCSQFQVAPLSEKDMFKLLRKTVKAEGDKLTKPVYESIIEAANGHPRNALQILDQVLAVDPEQRVEVAKQAEQTKSQSIELCRSLLNGAGWKKVSNILKDLKNEDPESIRRQVLGYCSTVLLSQENAQAGAIMEEFIEPFYNTGFPGLVYACFSVICGGD
jgi:DNA polymerase-3 subunit gamma/tau